jgi:hypothetical protein
MYWTDSIDSLSDGDLVLMHDLPNTADVQDEVLEKLTKRGVTFVEPGQRHIYRAPQLVAE